MELGRFAEFSRRDMSLHAYPDVEYARRRVCLTVGTSQPPIGRQGSLFSRFKPEREPDVSILTLAGPKAERLARQH